MEDLSGFCSSCNHKHRGVAQCKYCDCSWETVIEKTEESMNIIKKIWNKIKSWIKKII